MELAKEVKAFSSACEHILSQFSMRRPLTTEEAALIEYYCLEVLAKIAPLLSKTEEQISYEKGDTVRGTVSGSEAPSPGLQLGDRAKINRL